MQRIAFGTCQGQVYSSSKTDMLQFDTLCTSCQEDPPLTCSTPGMIGRSGKWPVNCGSLLVMHLMPTARLPASKCMTLSTRANGYLCGKIFLMCSSTVNTDGGCAMLLLQ
jgi:hypothetical protein